MTTHLPKLRVKPLYRYLAEGDEVCGLEEAARRFDFNGEMLVVVEGRIVNSHEELLRLASEAPYRDREFLEVTLVKPIAGG